MSTSEIAKLESRWRENPNGLTFAPLAEAYRKQRDPQRALEILAPGLERHPDYIPANIVLGRCHWDLNDLPTAERAFTHVLGLDGENVIALKALADITERLVRYDEAERWLEALLAVDRSNDEARAQLGRIHDLQQQRAEGSAAVPEAEAAAAQVEAEPPLVSTLEPAPPEPAPVEEPMPAPEALERPPEPPEPGEIASVEYIGWVARPDDLASAGVPLRVEDLETTPVPYTSEAEEPPAPPPEPPVEPEPAATFDRPFVPPSFPDPDSFGLEQSEDIVLNVSGHSEYQTPSAVDDLLAQVTGTPAGMDSLRRDLAPPEPITSALPGFAAPVDDPFAPPPAEPPPGQSPEPVSDRAESVDADPPPAASLFGRTADFYGLDEPPAAGPAGEAEPAATAAPEPVADRGPVGELDDAPPVGEPELVVTETMAEVFLRQGHLLEAITVYRELVRRSGGEQLAGRLAELEARQAAATAPPPRPAYAARDTGGQSVAAFFQSLLQTQPDNVPPRWPARPETPAAQPESVPDEASATRPAGEPLSLGSVFGEEPPPVAPAVGRPSGETPAPGSSAPGSFDDFFGSPPKSGAPTPPPATGRLHARSGDDLDQFHAWLQGLKR